MIAERRRGLRPGYLGWVLKRSPRCYARQHVSVNPMDSSSRDHWSGEEEDPELMLGVSRGHRGALAVLYDRYSPCMLGLALRLLGRRQEAEDLVHDVFMEAWKRAADYDPARGSVRAWLLLRTRSRSLDRKKSVRVKRSVSLDAELLPLNVAASAKPNPDRNTVRRVLADLPAEQREVLLLGYFEGLSSREIAEQVGIPVGTVKSRVAAALSKLRDALGERAQPPGATAASLAHPNVVPGGAIINPTETDKDGSR